MANFYCRSGDGQLHYLVSDKSSLTSDELQQLISRQLNLPTENFYWTVNGRTYGNDASIYCGFGSMLRSIGAQIEKTTNREACRDLSGRRMRDVNNEKKLADWVNAEAERKREIEERKKERIQRVLNPIVKPFEGDQYAAQVRASVDSVEDALKQGLKNAQSSTEVSKKRKALTGTSDSVKKRKTWFDDSDSSTDADDEDSDEDVKNTDTVTENLSERSDNKELSEDNKASASAAATEISSPSVSTSTRDTTSNESTK
ncbi:uncharacterized protein TRIADDRAFT_64218 [Trichoplax adhaerens]|uniref:SDE2-like domain-containing protein n=1 Tax=Trichoplax adhaerens TaxID=10228 RepID=B3S6J3_TRIAD|nr:hypothetical protein TRIADDRAFT_64218 [Trichoplax adhaerens]EDV21628.1 hypothetical protein TRIADDRAFT_64218 [Trichoplax adhaerens]|eukprot:XP_002115776.1 hypothetical protein TRIADDRAFT_64218 [Trichoplax adhaerens]